MYYRPAKCRADQHIIDDGDTPGYPLRCLVCGHQWRTRRGPYRPGSRPPGAVADDQPEIVLSEGRERPKS